MGYTHFSGLTRTTQRWKHAPLERVGIRNEREFQTASGTLQQSAVVARGVGWAFDSIRVLF